MKKLVSILIFMLLSAALFSQTVPQTANFSATVRDGSNRLLANTSLTMRISFYQGESLIYWEEHIAETNENGFVAFLLNREMSDKGGSVTNFAEIPWERGGYTMNVQYKRTGGDSFTDLGNFELASGFYAFTAQKLEGFDIDISDASNGDVLVYNATTGKWEATGKPTYDYSEIQNTPNIPTVPTTVSSFTNDANYISTETQTIADVAVLGNSVNTQLKNVTDPTENQDAATKKYVDDLNATLQATSHALETGTMGGVNGHTWVDLGLPSGTLWATCNVGATNPEDYGNYYAWGETITKDEYSWVTYSFCNGAEDKLTKYCNNSSYGNNGFTDALTTLEASDDAATASWGAGWRMPTYDEMNELKNNCTVTWTTHNGVRGRLFSGPNGNSIFLPAAGYLDGSGLHYAGTYGDYWSSLLGTNNPSIAWSLHFGSGNTIMRSYVRYYGFSVRPVCVYNPNSSQVPTTVSAFENDAHYITSADIPAQENADWNATSGAGQILNKPALFSGNYNDLTNKPTIPTVPTNVSSFNNDANYLTSYTETQTLANVVALGNSAGNSRITNVANPTANQDAATKKYVDDKVAAVPAIPTNVSAFTNDANYITSADVPTQVNADWNATSGAGQILNKPALFSGNYNDLTNKPTIPTVPTNVSSFTNDANYITSADVPAQVNADWNATSGAGQILNKPEIPTVPTNVSAFTNDANYISSETQTLANVVALGNSAGNSRITNVANPTANQDAATKKYVDDKVAAVPAIPTNVSAFTNDANYISSETQTLANVVALGNSAGNSRITNVANPTANQDAATKKYVDDKVAAVPAIPTNVSAFTNDANYITSADVPTQVNADWNATSGAGQILNKPALFSGNYNDLTNKPTIPTVPTNVSSFNNDANYLTSYTETQTLANVVALGNSAGNSRITNVANPTANQDAATKKYVDDKVAAVPAIPTNVSAFTNDANYITSADIPAQVNADWNATSGAGQILNKPEIPTVPTNVSAFTNDANYLTSYTETQTLANVVALGNSAGNSRITNVANPTANQDAATKKYVDDKVAAVPAIPTNVSAFTNDANYITSADVPTQVNADWNATSGAGQILNKPALFSGNYNDLTNKPTIPTVPTNVSSFTNDANYITSADVPAQVNADWNATSGAGQILNKPEIPTVPTNVSAFTNDANYLTSYTETQTLANVVALGNSAGNSRITNVANPTANQDAATKKYVDDKVAAVPAIPTNVSAFTNDANYITSADVPTQVNADWNATSGAGQILNKPALFSGNYNDLTNKPTIPTVPTNVSSFTNDANYITSADVPAQVNADWNATSGAGQILNKPEIPTVPTNVSAFTNDANYLTSYTETQTLANVVALGNSAGNSRITNVANPTANQDAATKYYVDNRTLTNVISKGNSAGNNRITNVANPTANQDAATKYYVDNRTLANVISKGNSAGNNRITNLANPTANQDAATKKYVDDLIETLQATIETLQTTIDAITLTVTFNANGGIGTMESQRFVVGVAQTISANTFTKTNYIFTGWNTKANGSGTAYTDEQSISISTNITLYAQWRMTTGTVNGHTWVDLGLPSGTKWATCNVGATTPEGYGNYFAWGETTTKDNYEWDNYNYCNGAYNSLTKYCNNSSFGNNGFTDALTTLEASDDAATANWGAGWRMPTSTEMQDLIDNCTVTWTTQSGVNGRLFTGPNGNSIFLPAAGERNESNINRAGSYGYYWSSSFDSRLPPSAWILNFYSGNYYLNNAPRSNGLSVRPVVAE